MKGAVVKADGTIHKHYCWKFDLKFLQEVVGGNIELVTTVDGKDMIVNEDAVALKLPYNPIATAQLNPDYKEGLDKPLQVLGDVFIFLKGKLK